LALVSVRVSALARELEWPECPALKIQSRLEAVLGCQVRR
jgi:hypothetical protein